MLANKQEFACRTVNASPGGMLVCAPAKGQVGEKVVLYFETLGRLEGEIVRHTLDGFALGLNLTSAKRERIADLLTWMVNYDFVGSPEDRRHQRITPRQTAATMVTEDGIHAETKIADVSISGVGLYSPIIPAVGSRVEVGRRSGRVVRNFDGGLAIEFSRLIPIEEFEEDIIL